MTEFCNYQFRQHVAVKAALYLLAGSKIVPLPSTVLVPPVSNFSSDFYRKYR